MELKPIGRMETDFPSKFGLPRQSGLADLAGRIVMNKEFSLDAFRGIEDFSHIWLLWGFSEVPAGEWSQTVRPPRLGGNKRVGVFATRAPYRPNPVGISVVKFEKLEVVRGELVIFVNCIDMIDGSPVYDIKPYLPISDCIQNAIGGFSDEVSGHRLEVDFPPKLLKKIDISKQKAIIEVLAQDPRPGYQADGRTYGFTFAGREIYFVVEDDILTVTNVKTLTN